MTKLFGLIDKLLFPTNFKCIACGKELNCDTPFCMCTDCFKNLPLIPAEHRCIVCGGQIVTSNVVCDECKSDKFDFEYCKSIFRYDQPISTLIRKLKYDNYMYLAEPLANLLAHFIEPISDMIDYIVPIPIHPLRYKMRGFNQSEVLLSALPASYSERINTNLVRRSVNNARQSLMNKAERRTNVKGIFEVIDVAEVKGKNILLFDDILTTGATMNECALTLKNSGANKVFALTLSNARGLRLDLAEK